MGVQVGKLHKNRVVKDLQGNIIDWFDEANGHGWIVRGRQVVNIEAWNDHVTKQKDKAEAAKAVTMAKVRDDYPEHKDGAAVTETKPTADVQELKNEVAELKEMLKKALEK